VAEADSRRRIRKRAQARTRAQVGDTPDAVRAEGATATAIPGREQRAATNQIHGAARGWALSGVMIVQFVSILSSTIINNGAPRIAGELDGTKLYAWLFASYTLAATISVPVVGKLSDALGRRVFYLAGLAAFLIGSVGSAAAQNMAELIAGRAVAGLGAGALLALTGATIGDIFPPRERAKWMGLIMTNYGLAAMLGPIVGGIIADRFGWRWMFLVTMPLAIAALVVLAFSLPRVQRQAVPVIDWLGILLLTVALLGLIVALTAVGVTHAWRSAYVLTSSAVGVAMIAAFFVHERRAAEPVMMPLLFRSPVFVRAVGLSFATRMVFFGLLAFFPVFLQGVRGESATGAGLELLPVMAAFIVGNVISGRSISWSGSYRTNAVAGPVILLAGTIVCAMLSPTSSDVTVDLAMVLVGLGVGTIFPLAATVVQSAFPYRILGTANSSRQFFDNLAQVIGISVMTTLTITIYTQRLVSRLPGSASVLADQSGKPQGLLSSSGQAAVAGALARTNGAITTSTTTLLHQSLAAGLHIAFVFALIISAAGVAVGARLPAVPLRTKIESS
jgi:EmrB/QacA subfamily drug resistance transporter